MSEKSLRVQLAAERKKMELAPEPVPYDPVEGILAQRARDQRAVLQMQADAPRNARQIHEDSPLSMGRFVNQVAAGLPAGVMKEAALALTEPGTVRGVGAGALLNAMVPGIAPVVQTGLHATGMAEGAGLALDATANEILAGAAQRDAYLYDRMSQVSRREELMAGIRGAELEAQNRANRDRRVDEGMREGFADALELGANIRDGAGNMIEHEGYLLNQAIGQAPTLALGPMGRGVAAAGAPARAHAAALAAQTPAREALRRAGMGQAASRIEARAAGELFDEASEAVTRRSVAVGGTAMEASAMYGEMAGEILGATLPELAEKYPGVQEQIEAGVSEQRIKNQLIDEVVIPAVATMAPISYGLMHVGAGLEMNPLGTPARGSAAMAGVSRNTRDLRAELMVDRMRMLGTNTLGEVFEEAGQGAGSALVGNVFEARRTGEENPDLLAGVGRAVGESIPVSGTFSAMTAAPGITADAAVISLDLGAQALVESMQAAGKVMKARRKKVEAKDAAKVNKDIVDSANKYFEAGANISNTLDPIELPEPVNLDLARSDTTVPEGLVDTTPEAEVVPQNLLTAHAKATMELLQGVEDPARSTQLQLFLVRNTRHIQNQIESVLKPALERSSDPAQKEQINHAIDILSGFTDLGALDSAREQLAQMPAEQVESLMASLPEQVADDSLELPQAAKDVINLVDELAIQAPEKLSVEQLERVLMQRSHMAPDQRSRLEAALEFARSRINYEAVVAEISNKTRKKPASVVTEQIYRTGFKEQGEKFSLKEHNAILTEAMAEGRINDARKHFKQLLNWTMHQQHRARSGQSEALRKLELGDDSFSAIESFRLEKDSGKRSNEDRFRLNPFQVDSAGAVELMAADAEVMREFAQNMANTYPELADVESTYLKETATAGSLMMVPRIPIMELGAPVQGETGRRRRIAHETRVNRVEREVALAKERGKNVQVSEDADGRVQFTDFDDMHRNQKAVSIIRPDGKPMTALQTERLMAGESLADALSGRPRNATKKQAPKKQAPEKQKPAPKSEPQPEKAAPVVEEAATPEPEPDPEPTPEDSQEIAEEADISEEITEDAANSEEIAEDTAEEAPAVRSLAERFSSLVQTVGDLVNKTAAQVRDQTNRFLAIYREPSGENQSLLNRVPGGVAQILEAIDNGELASLLPENKQFLATEDAIPGIRAFFAQDVDRLIQSMNKRLNHTVNTPLDGGAHKGKTRYELMKSGTRAQWDFPEWSQMHAIVENEDGTVGYHPEVAQAMAIATLQWVLENRSRPVDPDWDKIGRNWGGAENIPDDVVYGYTHGFYVDEVARSLPGKIRSILGLDVLPDAPLNKDLELMNSLAVNAIDAAAVLGYANVDMVEASNETSRSGSTMFFVNFNDTIWNQEESTPPPEDLIEALVDPYSTKQVSVGEPHAQQSRRAKGNAQNLSEEQLEVERKHNEEAFFINEELVDLLDRVGWDTFRQLRGYTLATLDLNINDRAAVDGLNQSIWYQDHHAGRVMAQIRDYALAHGIAPSEVPLHWYHRTLGTNGRVMAQGVSPQTDKLFRELFTQKPRTVTKGAEGVEDQLFAAMAQSLDLAKLEKVGIQASADALREVLWTPQVQALLEAIESPTAGEGFLSLAQAAGDVGLDIGNTKALHALQTLARYLKTEDGAEFSSALTVEIDGVNNGPHNAHLQFFYGDLTEEDLRQMRQGGVYVGKGKEVLLAHQGQDLGDRYTDVSDRMTALFRENAKDENTPDAVRALYQPMINLLHRSNMVEMDEGRMKSFKRSLGKAILVPVGYMSGQKAVSVKLVSTMLASFYAEISKSMAENRPVDPKMVSWISQLVSEKVDKDGNVSEGSFLNIRKLQQDPKNFTLSREAFKVMVHNVDQTLGRDAFQAGDENLKKSREVLSHVVELSQLQAALADTLYNRHYEQRRQELIEAGEISKFDSLSQSQEQELLQEFRQILPTAALAHTSEDDPNEGLSAVVKDRGRNFTVQSVQKDGTTFERIRKVMSMNQGISMNTTRSGIGDPRVSMAPLLTIGTGDVSMMHVLKLSDSTPKYLNIWDGIDTHFELMGEMGEAANQAAFQTWNYSALNSIVDGVNRIDPRILENLTEEDAVTVVATMMTPFQLALESWNRNTPNPHADPTESKVFWDIYRSFKIAPETTVRSHLGDARQLLIDKHTGLKDALTRARDDRQDTWTALKELGMSVDQMSGGGRAYVHPGTGEGMTDAEVVEYVRTRVAELRALREQQTESDPSTPTRTDRAGDLRFLVPSGSDRVQLNKAQALELLAEKGRLPGKVASAVMKMLAPLIPNDIQITLAPESVVRSMAAERGVETSQRWNGLYIPGQPPSVLVGNFSPVTLAHELVHAAIADILWQQLNQPDQPNKLSNTQRAAVKQLYGLATAFMHLDPESHADFRGRERLREMQDVMAGLRDAGNLAGMVNEFIAYTMTEHLVQDDLVRRKLPVMLQNLRFKVLTLVRRLLGLPGNRMTENWLQEVLGNVMNLAKGPTGPYQTKPVSQPSQGTLFQMAQGISAHESGAGPGHIPNHGDHLARVSEQFDQMLDQVNIDTRMPMTKQAYQWAQATTASTKAFIDSGYAFDAAQRAVFMKIQGVFSSGLRLDPNIMRGLYQIHDHVMRNITARDLMDDPSSTSEIDIREGEIRMAALEGHGSTMTGPDSRTNLLANFVALAQVDPLFREVLQKIPPMKTERGTEDLDQKIRDVSTAVIDLGNKFQTGVLKSKHQLAAVDALVFGLKDQQMKLEKRSAALARKSALERGESWVKERMVEGANLATQAAERVREKPYTVSREAVASLLDGLAAVTSDSHAKNWTEGMIGVLNAGNGAKPFRELLREIMGTAPSAQAFAKLLNQSKQAVSTMRQRLREETPKQIKKWFQTPLDKKTWQRLTGSAARTDLAAMWGVVPTQDLVSLLRDPMALAARIKELKESLPKDHYRHSNWLEGADDLAHWMVHQRNKSRGYLYRNAGALARQDAQIEHVDGETVSKVEPILDQLVTLRALELTSQAQKDEVANLLERDPEAMGKLLTTLQALSRVEQEKEGFHAANLWKGYVPESRDPRKQVRLATPQQAKELLRTGWRRLDSYKGDEAETQLGLAYYVSDVAGEVTYSQGALQMVVNTAGGSIAGTGHTLSDVTGLVISDPKAVARISAAKRENKGDPEGHNMIPIFGTLYDDDGNAYTGVTAYERTLDAGLVQAHTKGDSDLAVGIGIWMGRQTEEQLASQFNRELVEKLWESWNKEHKERGDEYIALNKSKDPIDQATWAAIPPQTQDLLLARFDGNVMVRNDIRNNAFGYRNISVREIFTGYTGLKPEVRQALEDVAVGLMGKNAYKFLAMGEDALTGVVGTSKDWIVVRSGIVAFVNLMSNQFQLVAQGVPVTELPRQFAIARQIETYLRNEHRLARLHAEITASTDTATKAKLDQEAKRIQEENSRLDIYDLVMAGELPTIAEGLSETDEYTLVTDATNWLEQRTQKLPKGVKEFGRYALITKDTALYQGMNRLIQFGDLMAKQLIYEKQLRDGKTKEQALDYVRDTFINYNLLPGRTRTALEQMGLLWFWNYKLRIQKIFLRAIRENPLRALAAFTVGDVTGADTLWSSSPLEANWSYSMGYGQLERAHQMNLWYQMFGD